MREPWGQNLIEKRMGSDLSDIAASQREMTEELRRIATAIENATVEFAAFMEWLTSNNRNVQL